MNAKLEKYLNTVEKHLNPLPASERIDIVKEIKSLIIELENDNVPTEIGRSQRTCKSIFRQPAC